MRPKYDYIVIGSGPAGHVAAIRAAQYGMRTALIEKDEKMLGGVCLNEGCIPGKSLFHGAKNGGADMGALVKKSREAVEQIKKGLLPVIKKNGVDVIIGAARFLDNRTVEVAGGEKAVLEAEKILIATGSAPRELPEMPFDGRRVITSSEAIRLSNIPKKMLIVGGGAIGTEFASFFNIMGAEVTIAEMEDSLLPSEDAEISRRFQTIFKQRGIAVVTGSEAKDIKSDGYDVTLVSVGRVPATSELGLDKAGLRTDEKGFIPVDGKMRTSAGNIYAAGDVVNTPMLAHVAIAEGEIAAEAASGGDPEAIDYSAVPNVVYTDIKVASVGMTEEKARAEGIEYAAGKRFFKANGRAVASGETEGFVKVIADKRAHKVLGAHIIGHGADEMIHEFVLAKRLGLTVEAIAKTVHAHPTLSEAAMHACKSILTRSMR